MKIRLPILALILSALATAAPKAADEWGIEHEEKARFEAKVVDILCELSGDCPDNCGDGRRQLGLLRDDGTLILPAKNQDIFAGAVRDLLPFCGRRLVADGLIIKDPQMTLFALQFKKPVDGEWRRANWFVRDWANENGVAPDADEARSWFRHDPTIKRIIADDGVYGIPGLAPED